MPPNHFFAADSLNTNKIFLLVHLPLLCSSDKVQYSGRNDANGGVKSECYGSSSKGSYFDGTNQFALPLRTMKCTGNRYTYTGLISLSARQV